MSGEREAVLRFLRAEEERFEKSADDATLDEDARERCRVRAGALRTSAAYIARGDHMPPEERTPETVLRAMWLAYEHAAQQAEAAYFAARDLIAETNAARRFTALDGRARVVRENLSRREGSPDDMNDMGPLLVRDYEARLSGARDLNAPPLEEP